MKIAVIYARYSSDSQTEQSIEGQLRVCEEYAKKNDIFIIGTYVDRAMTGKNDQRPDFQRMINDSAKREWDYVLVYKLDRFSRNKYEMAVHKKTLKDNGVKLLSAMEFIPDTPEAIIIESMLEGYAEYYSAELSQKIKRGNYESRRKGNVTNGLVPYGYGLKDKKAYIIEERAEVVRYIYEEYSKGVIVKDIIAALTAKGITYNNKPLAVNTVYNILKCEKYSGICHYGDEEYDNIFPKIIDKSLFEFVRNKISKNRYGRRSVKVVYIFRQKIFCGYCGKPVCAETGTAKSGRIAYYYKCSGRKRGSGCKCKTIRKDWLEKEIVNKLIESLSEPEIRNKIVCELLKMQEEIVQENRLLKIMIKEEKQAQNALNNILSAIEKGVFNKTTQKRMEELEEQIEKLQKQIAVERNKTEIKVTEKQIQDYYKQALSVNPRMLIDVFVERIDLFDDKVMIYFEKPLKTSPDSDNRGLLIYNKTVYLKRLNGDFSVEIYI